MTRGAWRRTCRIGKIVITGESRYPGNEFHIPYMGEKGLWYDRYKLTGVSETNGGGSLYRYELLQPGANTIR